MEERGRIAIVRVSQLFLVLCNAGIICLMLYLASIKPDGGQLAFYVIAAFHGIVAIVHICAFICAKYIAGDDAIPLLNKILANRDKITSSDINDIKKALDEIAAQNRDTSEK